VLKRRPDAATGIDLFQFDDFGDTCGMDRMSPELWNRIPTEAQAVFVQMAETIARLERKVVELESRVSKTPQNSSLPPQHPASARETCAAAPVVRQENGRSAGTSQARTVVDSA
jgi:hypothetical protein